MVKINVDKNIKVAETLSSDFYWLSFVFLSLGSLCSQLLAGGGTATYMFRRLFMAPARNTHQ